MKMFYSGTEHPYRKYHNTICRHLRQGDVVLDIGCGHEAPDLKKLSVLSLSKILVGLDVTKFYRQTDNLVHLITANASNICLKKDSVNLVISRSVLEHLNNPLAVFTEVHRVLKGDGYFIFLTPNIYDYSALFAKLIPDRYHEYIVSKTEGRKAEDIFPTFYKVNSHKSIHNYAKLTGFKIVNFEYLGQYPAYLTFNPLLFLLGTAYDKLITRYDSLKSLRGWILAVLTKKPVM
jgi:SAM-dependent methyltransferase